MPPTTKTQNSCRDSDGGQNHAAPPPHDRPAAAVPHTLAAPQNDDGGFGSQRFRLARQIAKRSTATTSATASQVAAWRGGVPVVTRTTYISAALTACTTAANGHCRNAAATRSDRTAAPPPITRSRRPGSADAQCQIRVRALGWPRTAGLRAARQGRGLAAHWSVRSQTASAPLKNARSVELYCRSTRRAVYRRSIIQLRRAQRIG